MSTPLVSIITPTYHRNDLNGVQRMLRSVHTQTYPNWEHLIYSDGEWEPHIGHLVAGINDERQRYGVTDRHHGGYGAAVRQEVMETKASGKYFVFLDDDNFIFPDYLERMVDALERAEGDERFAICSIIHFGPVQDFVGQAPLYLRGEPKLYWIDTLQVMVQAEAMLKVGWNDNSYFADGLTFEELGRQFDYVRVEQCLGVHI